MARDNKGFLCHAHPHMVSFEIHHVWPTGYHGPNTKANKIKICCNAHSDIHFLMELMFKDEPFKPREFGPAIRKYARAGYLAVMAYAEELSK